MEKCPKCKSPMQYKIKHNHDTGTYTNYHCTSCNIDVFIDNPFNDGDIDYCQDEGE